MWGKQHLLVFPHSSSYLTCKYTDSLLVVDSLLLHLPWHAREGGSATLQPPPLIEFQCSPPPLTEPWFSSLTLPLHRTLRGAFMCSPLTTPSNSSAATAPAISLEIWSSPPCRGGSEPREPPSPSRPHHLPAPHPCSRSPTSTAVSGLRFCRTTTPGPPSPIPPNALAPQQPLAPRGLLAPLLAPRGSPYLRQDRASHQTTAALKVCPAGRLAWWSDWLWACHWSWGSSWG